MPIVRPVRTGHHYVLGLVTARAEHFQTNSIAFRDWKPALETHSVFLFPGPESAEQALICALTRSTYGDAMKVLMAAGHAPVASPSKGSPSLVGWVSPGDVWVLVAYQQEIPQPRGHRRLGIKLPVHLQPSPPLIFSGGAGDTDKVSGDPKIGRVSATDLKPVLGMVYNMLRVSQI